MHIFKCKFVLQPIKLTATIVESGVKHHNPNLYPPLPVIPFLIVTRTSSILYIYIYIYIYTCILNVYKKFEDTKWVITRRKSNKDRQYNVQKKRDKERSTKNYTENQRSSNGNTTNTGVKSVVARSSCSTSDTSRGYRIGTTGTTICD